MAQRRRQSPGTGARGESFLQVEDKSYPILFTNRAIFRAERATGKAVLEIANLIQEQTLSMGDLMQMLLVGLEAGRRDAKDGTRPYQLTNAWDILDAVGFRAALVAVFEALAEVLSYAPLEFELPEALESDESPPGG